MHEGLFSTEPWLLICGAALWCILGDECVPLKRRPYVDVNAATLKVVLMPAHIFHRPPLHLSLLPFYSAESDLR